MLWPPLRDRNRQAELMDDPGLDEAVHRRALAGLDRLQAVSRTATRIWNAVAGTVAGETSVRWLDVAGGSGRIASGIVAAAEKRGVTVRTVSVDLSGTAVRRTLETTAPQGLGVVANACRLPFASGTFDVASCTLFLHHLDPPDVQQVLSEMTRVADLVVVDDLRRTRTGHLLAHIAGRLLSRSPVVHVDGPRSVEGAYTSSELLAICEDAGLTVVQSLRQWPQRTLLVLRRKG